MYKLILVILSIWSISSCIPSKGTNTLRLTKSELSELISIIDSNIRYNPHLNYHVLYGETFNDSTIVIEICNNGILAHQELGVCEFFKIEHCNVFIYDSKLCRNTSIPDSLISKEGGHPFYIPDSPYWSILVSKREGQIIFRKMELLPRYLKTDVPFVEDSEIL